ncbi:ethanolamine utilization protein EutJ [Cephaloticoccus capnophilus]|uniref:Ethanolamine utilization protein EutJ n=2 Tax=Cephaloticoccus capnophilus TaxID=1548208 RepID=A0A139SM90_9BACT|nr:ethanolamine utilization protein EutJ [Cephaloticoccus capnophilus]
MQSYSLRAHSHPLVSADSPRAMNPLPLSSSLAALATAALLSLTGCAPSRSSDAASGEIRVGEISSITGKEAACGQSTHRGIVLAIEEANARGGLLGGRPLRLITEDNQSKAGDSGTAARKLISRDEVIAILGEVASNRSLEIASIAQRSQTPMISPGSTAESVTEAGDYIFRVCFLDAFQGKVMAKFARESLALNRIATLSSVSSAYSVGLANHFKETFVAGGASIAAEQKFAEGDKDFRAQLTAIRASQADAIYIPAYYTETALICKQARELGLTLPLLGGDGWASPKLLEIGGEAVEGIYYSAPYSSESTAAQALAFIAKYRERWDGETPDAFAALGYDAALLLIDSLERAGTTEPAALRDAIASTRGLLGATGRTDIDENGNALKAATIMTVKDGKFSYVGVVTP